MDATFLAVSRLWEQKYSRKQIEKNLGISYGKVTKILVTIGALETVESKIYSNGMNADEIAEQLNESKKVVLNRLPYEKGMYNSEYPSKNALKIRKTREKQSKDG